MESAPSGSSCLSAHLGLVPCLPFASEIEPFSSGFSFIDIVSQLKSFVTVTPLPSDIAY
jgi:hypothetical protein